MPFPVRYSQWPQHMSILHCMVLAAAVDCQLVVVCNYSSKACLEQTLEVEILTTVVNLR